LPLTDYHARMFHPRHVVSVGCVGLIVAALGHPRIAAPHGTIVSPKSRVYRVYQSNPENPSFPLAANAVALDGTLSYYTWNEVSRNIPAAVQAGLPPGFDYSPWIPDGELASAGRTDPWSLEYPRTYVGLDQASGDWPTENVTAGQTLNMSFQVTAFHTPSVWDVWMTTPDWDASTPLRWSHMEYLGRPTPNYTGTHFTFDMTIPTDRSGHHVLWVAWQRDDPVGEVFFSTSDVLVMPANDECTDATPLQLGANGPFDTQLATPSVQQASCQTGAGEDLWFRYTPACTGNLRVATCGNSTAFDSVVSIWSGSCVAPTEIGCDDDGCGPSSVAQASVNAGTTYLIKVATKAGTPPGTFDLHVSFDNSTGNLTTTTTGCGTATLTAQGAPNLGGFVSYSVQNATGTSQALLFGLTPSTASMCPNCVLGTNPIGTLPPHMTVEIPRDPSLIGGGWFVQGIDAFGTTGGCNLGGGVDFTLTETVRTVVGS